MTDSEPSQRLGRFVETPVAGEIVRAFVPPPLPPSPPINVLALLDRLSLAERALGRLDGITMLLPRQELFLYMYVRKEAVLSSQIEGTQSTLTDLLRFETEAQAGEPIDDIREVSNYIDAMMYGLERLEELPLSLRLIREMHARLLQSGRGGTKSPGEFRRSQNRIGGSRPGNALYVPPPVTELDACLDALERFMHEDESRLPALIKAGLLHVQFETIHPFLDGNGRLGRLMIVFFLVAKRKLTAPLLYLSAYIETHRSQYYDALQAIREQGDPVPWVELFLRAAQTQAEDAVVRSRRILELRERYRESAGAMSSPNALGLVDLLCSNPIVTTRAVEEELDVTRPTALRLLKTMEQVGILTESGQGARGQRRYVASEMMQAVTGGSDE